MFPFFRLLSVSFSVLLNQRVVLTSNSVFLWAKGPMLVYKVNIFQLLLLQGSISTDTKRKEMTCMDILALAATIKPHLETVR